MVFGRGGLYRPHREDITIGGLGLQDKPDESSVINIFEGSLTEEGTGAENDIFKRVFKFVAYDKMKKFDGTDSSVHIE